MAKGKKPADKPNPDQTLTYHERLVRDAKEAIDTVHRDLSVPANSTLRDLKDVRDHIDILIDALQVTVGDDDGVDLG